MLFHKKCKIFTAAGVAEVIASHISFFFFYNGPYNDLGFPCGSPGKESACNVGDLGLIPGLGRSPGEGKGYPLQDSGLEKSMDLSMGLQRVRQEE